MNISPLARATAGVGFTQIVGWGTTYLMPSVLGRHMQASLDMPAEMIFAGITVSSAAGAIFAPKVGRFVDTSGARAVMTAGSLIYALSLIGLSQCWDVLSYLVFWAIIGVGSGLALSTTASIALVQIAGPRARQTISLLTIIAGLSSTLFRPITGMIDAAVGWRATLLVFAALHLFVCLPIHFLILPSRPPVHPAATGGAGPTVRVAPEHHSRVYLLLSISLTSGAFVFTGVQLQMIEMLRGLGHSPASALLLASLIGPCQVGIRIFELLFGHRYTIMKSAVLGSVLLPVGLSLALLAGDIFVVAFIAVAAYGLSNGLKAVQRSTLPLALFGRTQFGLYAGRLALPQGIMSAIAPPAMAGVISQFGTAAALWLCLAMGMVSLVAMILLARRTPGA